MPSTTKALEILVRKKPLDEADWRVIAESRRARINPHLDSFTLRTLGDVECLRRESHWHKIGIDHPEIAGDEGLSLDTQGIFPERKWYTEPDPRPKLESWESSKKRVPLTKSTRLLWGLARSGFWILCTIKAAHESGHKGRGYERATTVTIKETTLGGILEAIPNETAEQIAETLGLAVQNWVKKRRELLRRADKLLEEILVEESVLRQIKLMQES